MSVQDADFLCLQEVDHYEDYYEKLLRKLKFKVYYAQRPGVLRDGSLIAWNPEVWTPCFLEKLDFDQCPEAEKNRDFVRNNVGVLGVFGNKAGEKLLVANVHLFWDPQFENVKIAQARFLLSKVSSTSDLSSLGILITGDFNSQPFSRVYDLMTGPCASPGFPLQSAYSNYRDGHHPDFTNFTQDFQGTLDYIFHSEVWRVQNLAPLPDTAECKKEIALPNSKYGSDHLPLVAVFGRNG